jgi:type II secretory pathway pseudopilin PulG
MIQKTTPMRMRQQRGMSLIGLMAWAIIIGFIGYLAVRVLPTVNEFLTVQRAVDRVAADSPATVGEVRKAFERQKDIEYSISSISAKDLEITKENEKLVIRFAYDKEIPIVEPVYLLIKYRGRSK